MTSNPLSKKNTKILILGKGYVGTNIWLDLILDYNNPPLLIYKELVNYHDTDTLRHFIQDNHISVVINAAGFTGRPNVDEAELKKELCWDLNVMLPLKINTLCNELKVKYIHISSGCIYTGYEKVFTEEDKPNFGLFNYSSFYSKSKHAFELLSQNLNNKILRVRMPLSLSLNEPRNFMVKIKNYDNVISYRNSKTWLNDLSHFIKKLIEIDDVDFWDGQDIYNVVNPNPLTTEDMMEMMEKFDYYNPDWKIVETKELDIKAPRSNCVLDHTKTCKIHQMRSEGDVLEEILWNYQDSRNYN